VVYSHSFELLLQPRHLARVGLPKSGRLLGRVAESFDGALPPVVPDGVYDFVFEEYFRVLKVELVSENGNHRLVDFGLGLDSKFFEVAHRIQD